jgi:hypothetical protein
MKFSIHLILNCQPYRATSEVRVAVSWEHVRASWELRLHAEETSQQAPIALPETVRSADLLRINTVFGPYETALYRDSSCRDQSFFLS